MLTTYTKVRGSYLILAQVEESRVEGREEAVKSWSEPKARKAVGVHGKPLALLFLQQVRVGLCDLSTGPKRIHVTSLSSWQRDDLGNLWGL